MAASIVATELSTINTYIFGVISIHLNGLLVFVIHRRAAHRIGSYRHMMIICALFDATFSAVYIVVSPTFAAARQYSALLIVNGGFVLPEVWGRMLLIVFIFLLCHSIILPPCLFVFRYLQICRTVILRERQRRIRRFVALPSAVSVWICATLCFAAWPTSFDLKQFAPIAFEINVRRNTTFLVATLHKSGDAFDKAQSITLLIGTLSVIAVLVTSMGVMVFCSREIFVAVANSGCANTRRLHIQLCKLLVAQAALPFVFLHLPFYISVVAPLFGAKTGEVSNYFPFLFAWCPALNPLNCLLLRQRSPCLRFVLLS